ncbi:hypothetical protein D9X91_11360 [Falsibacillus albus]|uniref:Uncharacterized protein n=1 Tax=Falsibacillus albus TaxID=2478915 RepID=A0A3L7JZG9_9BACI|nr:hypothetical protein D9X91_11360 [Falsibacillus albus]
MEINRPIFQSYPLGGFSVAAVIFYPFFRLTYYIYVSNKKRFPLIVELFLLSQIYYDNLLTELLLMPYTSTIHAVFKHFYV